MPKKIDFTLTKVELKALELAIRRDKRPKVRTRATALRALHLGSRPDEVAEMFLVTQASIYNWWHAYQSLGLEGLADKPKRMPRRKITEAYLAALATVLESDPQALGYDFAIWTRERLCDHLAAETGIHLSADWLGVIMREEGYVFRRPRHDLSNKQDLAAKRAAAAALEELKKDH